MHSDPFDDAEQPGADGWLEVYETKTGLRDSLQAATRRTSSHSTPSTEELAARARLMALFCHMSVLFGLPVFLLPFWSRDDPFVLHHAKAAATIVAVFYGGLVLAILVNPWFFAATICTYLPGLMAVHYAAGGKKAGWLALGPVGELMFFPLQVESLPKLLESKEL